MEQGGSSSPTVMDDGEDFTEAVNDLFGKSASAMLLADDDRVYRNANQAACDMLSVEPEEIIGKRIDDFTDPALLDQVPALYQAFLDAGSLSGDFTLETPAGKRVECSYSASANVVPGLHLTILIPREQVDPELDIVEETNNHPTGLTEREKEVLSMLALGETNTSIAEKLHLSPETVRSHTRSARLRLGARSRSHAIALALQSGQLELG